MSPARRKPIRIGVVGVGYVGTFHAQTYRKFDPTARLTAVYDANPQRAQEVAAQVGCHAAGSLDELIDQVDAASVCVPTSLHRDVGCRLLSAGVHVLIEKPIATSLTEADVLLTLAQRHRLILQVGHIERFNAAILTAQKYLTRPRFIEAHRLSAYPFRGTDVSVVLDVMIHDLDLLLALVGAPPTRIDAVGVSVLSPTEDIANARLAFASGCVANLTASRVSDESVRRIRLFQEDCYLSIDYKQQTVDLARKTPSAILRTSVDVRRRPPLEDQLRAFVDAVRTGRRPLVSGEEARSALALALEIERRMRGPILHDAVGARPPARRVRKATTRRR
jgi:predicted dehydrogenase